MVRSEERPAMTENGMEIGDEAACFSLFPSADSLG
jgi:hypothetical protein